MNKDSLKKRYFYKLSTNLFSMLMRLFVAGMVPRALGPAAYGSYTFLTSYFTQVVNFLDMGTSLAFYTKLSQRQKDLGLISFYFYFVLAVISAILAFVLLSFFTPLYAWLWPGQVRLFILLAAGWGILSWINTVFIHMTDAYGLTVKGEIVRVINRGLITLTVILLFTFGWLTLANYFALQYVFFVFLLLAVIFILKRNKVTLKHKLTLPEAKTYGKEFYKYSHPLFVSALAGLFAGILNRWLLQVFSGDVQQGFYGLSFAIGSFCFMFTGAMTPLLMREFSIAHGNSDLKKMAVLFRQYIPLLYSIAAYIACFVAVQSGRVVYLLGGGSYEAALLPVAVMAFYSIHRTYGQLSGSIFFATGQTALYRNIVLITTGIGLVATYFLLAPVNMFGLQLGALGLAIRMVAIQFVAVNIQLFFNAKYLKISFIKYLGHQIFSVAVFMILASIAARTANLVLQNHVLPNFILSGMLYSLLVFMMLCFFPKLFGLNKENLYSIMKTVKIKMGWG